MAASLFNQGLANPVGEKTNDMLLRVQQQLDEMNIGVREAKFGLANPV